MSRRKRGEGGRIRNTPSRLALCRKKVAEHEGRACVQLGLWSAEGQGGDDTGEVVGQPGGEGGADLGAQTQGALGPAEWPGTSVSPSLSSSLPSAAWVAH